MNASLKCLKFTLAMKFIHFLGIRPHQIEFLVLIILHFAFYGKVDRLQQNGYYLIPTCRLICNKLQHANK